MSRWDRPPEPHDWRWVVGHIGRAMIAVGLLMFGFVAYQLWGTGIQTARAQNHLDSEFDHFIEENGVTVDTIGPATTTTIGSVDSPTSVLPPVSVEPVEQNFGAVDPGDGIAELKIPSIGVNYKVVAGVSVKDLRAGPGHFPNTPLPGQLGNSAIAGHRTTYGAPFYDLDKLRVGDEIQLTTRLGDAYVYVVTGTDVVNPDDYHVITDSDPTKATITLITCTPRTTAKQRLVVFGTLDTSRSSQVGEPVLNYGQTEPIAVDTVLPGDDTGSTLSSTSDAPSSEVPTTDTTATSSAAVVTTGSTTPAGQATSSGSAFNQADAFSQGWFSDGPAWPHVIFWGGLLALVWYGAYRLAKHFRRLWLGFLVGFVPFVVVLYFFYENVNRLLPAAI